MAGRKKPPPATHADERWLLTYADMITLLMAPRYTATAQLEISREQKQITKVEGLESDQAGQDNEFYATQYALLKARPVAEKIGAAPAEARATAAQERELGKLGRPGP